METTAKECGDTRTRVNKQKETQRNGCLRTRSKSSFSLCAQKHSAVHKKRTSKMDHGKLIQCEDLTNNA
jgi:hypothetical protein